MHVRLDFKMAIHSFRNYDLSISDFIFPRALQKYTSDVIISPNISLKINLFRMTDNSVRARIKTHWNVWILQIIFCHKYTMKNFKNIKVRNFPLWRRYCCGSVWFVLYIYIGKKSRILFVYIRTECMGFVTMSKEIKQIFWQHHQTGNTWKCMPKYSNQS